MPNEVLTTYNPYSFLTDLNPEFGGPWDMLGIYRADLKSKKHEGGKNLSVFNSEKRIRHSNKENCV